MRSVTAGDERSTSRKRSRKIFFIRPKTLIVGVSMFPLPDRAGLATRPPEANPHATRRRIWVVCGLLVLAVGLVFGQTVTCDFVNWDDPQYVYENAHVRRGMSIEGVVWAFISRDASNWHPLTWMSHMLDCQAYGLWAGGHHLTNVLIHAATSVGLFLVLRRMTGRLWPSAWWPQCSPSTRYVWNRWRGWRNGRICLPGCFSC